MNTHTGNTATAATQTIMGHDIPSWLVPFVARDFAVNDYLSIEITDEPVANPLNQENLALLNAYSEALSDQQLLESIPTKGISCVTLYGTSYQTTTDASRAIKQTINELKTKVGDFDSALFLYLCQQNRDDIKTIKDIYDILTYYNTQSRLIEALHSITERIKAMKPVKRQRGSRFRKLFLEMDNMIYILWQLISTLDYDKIIELCGTWQAPDGKPVREHLLHWAELTFIESVPHEESEPLIEVSDTYYWLMNRLHDEYYSQWIALMNETFGHLAESASPL